MLEMAFDTHALCLHPDDNVAIARQDIPPGTTLLGHSGETITITEHIPAGHKFALYAIPPGEQIKRYGYGIGMATVQIEPGSWVHSHNLEVGNTLRSAEWCVVPRSKMHPARDIFMGYQRTGGGSGTRNLIAIIAASNCAAHAVAQIARAFTPERLANYPNIDGVVPIIHHSGCGLAMDGLPYRYLARTLANIALNPNVGACLFVGLGCEVCQVIHCAQTQDTPGQSFPTLVIQEQGGFRKTVTAGIRLVEDLLPAANSCVRTPRPVSELLIALQCGGSDSWSGVTANPLAGLLVDKIAQQGGTAVLAETPEIFGAEHLLARRVVSPEVGQKLNLRFNWWNEQSQLLGFSVDNNPTPGNKQGGLTTIFEKSLGAVAKGGASPLSAVYEYAERVTERGLVFMDTPGFDPVSITGQLAGGCNLILFTTGRGSVFGSNLAPCLKIASHTALFERMEDDMDFNAGQVLQGQSFDKASLELYELMLAVASGARTRSEHNGLPDCEFVPWQPGVTL